MKTGKDWDERLLEPFALAPCDLLKRHEVTEENYCQQNLLFGGICEKIMLEELKTLPHGQIELGGVGLGRDLGWMQHAGNEFVIRTWDISSVACQNARRLLGFTPFLNLGFYSQVDFMIGLKSEIIETEGIVAIYACQFLEHQGDAIPEFARCFGKFLRAFPERRVFLVLPRREDNPPRKVKWNAARPPLDHEWQRPLNEGFGGKVKVEVLGKPSYYHRKYTFFRLSA